MTLSLCHTAIRKEVILSAEWLLFSLVINLPLQSSESHVTPPTNEISYTYLKQPPLQLQTFQLQSPSRFLTVCSKRAYVLQFKMACQEKKKNLIWASLPSLHWMGFVSGWVHFHASRIGREAHLRLVLSNVGRVNLGRFEYTLSFNFF